MSIGDEMKNSIGTLEAKMVEIILDVGLEKCKDMNLLLDGDKKLDFIYNKLIKQSSRFKETANQPKELKSNETSFKYRAKGNDCFIKRKMYLEALECYTQSIAYADTLSDSSFLAMSYANRSAVLFDRGYYKECLKDIEYALENDYPNHLKEKLLNRKKKSEELMVKQKPINYYSAAPEILNKNSFISAASDSVKININEQFGRHVIAVKPIKVGEVVSLETSFVHSIHQESKLLHCHECLELCYNLIPCESCIFALYCSQTCLKKAFDSYHKYGCHFVPFIHQHSMLFYKMTLKYLKEPDDVNKDTTFRSDRSKEMMQMVTHDDKMDHINFLIPLMVACIVYHNFKSNPQFLTDFDFDEIDSKLKLTLYKTSLIDVANPFTIKKIKYLPNDTESKRVGTALYSFSSLFSHSCVPNVEFFHHGTLLVTRAIANIKIGEQCTICYRASYSTTSRDKRQQIYSGQYRFECQCKACVNNWPTFHYLPLGPSVPPSLERKVQRNTFEDTDTNKKLMEEILEEALRLYDKMEKFEPCKNLLVLQNLIVEIYTSIGCCRLLTF